MGHRVEFTTAKLLKSSQYQKILKISAISGLALQYFLVLATLSKFNCINNHLFTKYITTAPFVGICHDAILQNMGGCLISVISAVY